MESIGYVEVGEEGPSVTYYGRDAPPNQPAIKILMCSKEICGYVHHMGMPGTLRFTKEIRISRMSIRSKEIHEFCR